MDIQINGNIQEMKTKVMGNFSSKQLICVIIAAVIEIAGVTVIKMFFPATLISYLLPLPLALIPIAFGWADEILHMSLQEYWDIVIYRRIHMPKFRPFAIHNYIETQEARILQEEKQALAAEATKNKAQKNTTAKVKNTEPLPDELTRYE